MIQIEAIPPYSITAVRIGSKSVDNQLSQSRLRDPYIMLAQRLYKNCNVLSCTHLPHHRLHELLARLLGEGEILSDPFKEVILTVSFF